MMEMCDDDDVLMMRKKEMTELLWENKNWE